MKTRSSSSLCWRPQSSAWPLPMQEGHPVQGIADWTKLGPLRHITGRNKWCFGIPAAMMAQRRLYAHQPPRGVLNGGGQSDFTALGFLAQRKMLKSRKEILSTQPRELNPEAPPVPRFSPFSLYLSCWNVNIGSLLAQVYDQTVQAERGIFPPEKLPKTRYIK